MLFNFHGFGVIKMRTSRPLGLLQSMHSHPSTLLVLCQSLKLTSISHFISFHFIHLIVWNSNLSEFDPVCNILRVNTISISRFLVEILSICSYQLCTKILKLYYIFKNYLKSNYQRIVSLITLCTTFKVFLFVSLNYLKECTFSSLLPIHNRDYTYFSFSIY